MPKEDFKELSDTLTENKTGLDHIDKHVYTKMYGYKDVNDYYNKVSLCSVTKNITVPTFAFGAKDDNLCGYQFTPFEHFNCKGSQLFLASSDYGAHATHLMGSFSYSPWYKVPCMEWLLFVEGKLSGKAVAGQK